jgi:large subunit ribosomal protein L17
MRHRVVSTRLGRSTAHLKALRSALVRALIKEQRITTTLAKAKMASPLAERMVTLARRNTLAARRRLIATLSDGPHIKRLFEVIVPKFEGRQGGYTRIMKLGRRPSDSSEMAILEWIGAELKPRRQKKAGEAEGEADKK